jgi:hypothetical protein
MIVTPKTLAVWTIAGAAALVMGSAADAASSLANSLTGFAGDSSQPATQAALAAAGFNVSSTDAEPSITFDAAGAHFGAATAGDGGRNYMRTNDSDYATLGFVAEITIETTTDDQAVFIGLGAGDTALFGTPDWSTQFSSASFWLEFANDKFTRFRTANDVNAFADTMVSGGLDPGLHRFRMTFDPTASSLLGEIDKNHAGGPFVADAVTFNFPIDTSSLFSADGWPGEDSRIFFGGDDGAIFRDLSITVIPEPGTFVLALVGCVGLAGHRWRRAAS